MCGVAGAIASRPDARVGSIALALTRALAHRGPDGEGFWSNRSPDRTIAADHLSQPTTLVVGHRRLSIVDLDGGAQPMANEDSTVWVSFNGEIYNQRELRRELESHGHRFCSDADTEVLVHGWEEWGERMFGRLNGIFTFALVDVVAQETWLVRDPIGVKPLYVGVDGDLTWWASELQAAHEAGVDLGGPSADALKLFFTFRFVPSPRTLFTHAWKLPPGHFVRLRSSAAGRPPRFEAYGCEIRSSHRPTTARAWQEALLAELADAVDRQLMADVPVASLLSGGVDSSLITQLMTGALPSPPQTFGIGFASDGPASEAAAAARAAALLGVPHRSTSVVDDDYVAEWPLALARLGEPIANSSSLLVSLICADVGRSHKVVLSGQGADEPLGGYPRHLIERLQAVARRVPLAAPCLTRASFGREDAARLQRALRAPDRPSRYVEIFSVFPSTHVDRIVGGGSASTMELATEAVRRWTTDAEPDDLLNELLRVDARMSLADDLLEIGDHFAMQSSVELRVPFLDLAFLELAERMPSRFKISLLGSRKWLYSRGALRLLPTGIAAQARPPRLSRKRGFSLPRSWLDVNPDLLTAESWRASAAALALRAEAIDLAGAPPGPRQRNLLYALTAWTRSHEPALG